MKLASFRGVDIVCSPLLMLALPAAYLAGRVGRFAAAFASLSVHEAAHAIAARRAGCAVESVELQPFGFIAKLDCSCASRHDAAAVFAAGPVASLVLAASFSLAVALVSRFFTGGAYNIVSALGAVSDINLQLAAVNLLPALPLDGGRMLSVLLNVPGRSSRAASSVLAAVGVLAGAALIAAFALLMANGVFNPSLALMGGFLALSAAKELKTWRAPPIRHRGIGPKGAIAVKQLAVGHMATVGHTLGLLPAGAYSVVCVLRGDRLIGTLTEAQLVSAAQKLGASATLLSAVAYCSGEMV